MTGIVNVIMLIIAMLLIIFIAMIACLPAPRRDTLGHNPIRDIEEENDQ